MLWIFPLFMTVVVLGCWAYLVHTNLLFVVAFDLTRFTFSIVAAIWLCYGAFQLVLWIIP